MKSILVPEQLRLCFILDEGFVLGQEPGCLTAPYAQSLIQSGVTSILLRGLQSQAEYTRSIREFVEVFQNQDRLVLSVDNCLQCLDWDLDGVFCTQPFETGARWRAILGTKRLLGQWVGKESDLSPSFMDAMDLWDFLGVGPVSTFGAKVSQPLGVHQAEVISKRLMPKPLFWFGGIQLEDILTWNEAFAQGIGVQRLLAEARTQPQNRLEIHKILSKKLGPSRLSNEISPMDFNFRF